MSGATPATASRSLPKSNSHHSIASMSDVRGLAAPPTIDPAPPQTDISVPSFNPPPSHVIASRDYSRFHNLIIVCCHAIFHPDASDPSFPLNSPYDETNWHLASFQKSDSQTGKPGEQETFLGHISAGFDTLTLGSWGENSLLCFSGGATKRELTELTEARSYYHAALSQALYHGHRAGGHARELFEEGRILLEEHATDSFQNLLFSILLFRRTTGRYPSDVRVITHAFKARRFLDLHAPAIRWPTNSLKVQGIDPVMSRADHEDTLRGEERFGYAAWQDDPLGTGELLSKKRRQRGWEDGVHEELGEGLEDGVRVLLKGKASEDLPWVDKAEFKRIDSITTR